MSLLRFRWQPSQEELQNAAREVLYAEVFGEMMDLGPWLLEITRWHQSQTWEINELTEADKKRAEALDALSVLTRIRLGEGDAIPTLNLELARRAPQLMTLPYAMCVKVPVVSFRRFLDINARFAFNSIRKSKHPNGDELISYLYEIIFLQQKLATALHEFMRFVALFGSKKSKDALLINAEMDAIMKADLIFSYLKASLEKTVALTGLIYGASNLDSKKNHASRMKALLEAAPDDIESTPYGALLREFLKSENLEELNSYRSGLLHKRGVADLQPHNYVGREAANLPFRKIFDLLHEQHTKNTCVLLSALALLTDRLVILDPPEVTPQTIFECFGDSLAALICFLGELSDDATLAESPINPAKSSGEMS
ncbi:MAG: hypothetical protein U1F81_10575 [Verrucomicrobiaceae bacterium]